MSVRVAPHDLAQQARQWIALGQPDQAARTFERLLSEYPDFSDALLFLGQQRLHRGEFAAARSYFERACRAAPHDPIAAMNLAFACRGLADLGGERAALDAALAADPYCYPALLAKGELAERTGKPRQAGRFYGHALKLVPAEGSLSPAMQASVHHAREVVAHNVAEMDAWLEARLAPVRAQHGAQRCAWFEEARNAVTGRGRIYRSEASLLQLPQLPAIAFHDDRSRFPWLAGVEAATDDIRSELLALLRTRQEQFRPYVHYDAGQPLNQWAELNHSPRWSVEYLWERGEPNPAVQALCPRTVAALKDVPFSTIPGVAPDVVFSALQPKTRIPPHSGVSNARLLVHLPLIIPEGCGFRVGNDMRQWQEGTAWVFDDTIEHEAWNDSDQLRVIMIFEVWHPDLSASDCALIAELVRSYYAYEAG